jgi:hypothetical protein
MNTEENLLAALDKIDALIDFFGDVPLTVNLKRIRSDIEAALVALEDDLDQRYDKGRLDEAETSWPCC